MKQKITTEVLNAGYPFWCLNIWNGDRLLKSTLFFSKREAEFFAKKAKKGKR